MKHVTAAALITAALSCASAQPRPDGKNSHFYPVENVQARLPLEAKNHRHVLFVNVDAALPEQAFAEAAAYIRMILAVHVCTNSARTDLTDDVLRDGRFPAAVSTNAALVVALVNQPAAGPILALPERYARVNVHGFDADNPEPVFRKKRLRQLFMRGLAFACGGGMTADPLCVMNCPDFYSPAAMDRASATYGPFALPAIYETLSKVGRGDLFVISE